MHKIKNLLPVFMTICALICWWGYFFPELTLTPDTVQIIVPEAEQTSGEYDATVEDIYEDLYRRLLTAKPEQIRIRCQLFTKLSSYWEALNDGSK